MTRALVTPWPVSDSAFGGGDAVPAAFLPAGMIVFDCTRADAKPGDSPTLVGPFWWAPAGMPATRPWHTPWTEDHLRIEWTDRADRRHITVSHQDDDPWARTDDEPTFWIDRSGQRKWTEKPSTSAVGQIATSVFYVLSAMTLTPLFKDDRAIKIPGTFGFTSLHFPFDGTTIRILEQDQIFDSEGETVRARIACVLRDDQPLAEGRVVWRSNAPEAVRYWPAGSSPYLDPPDQNSRLFGVIQKALRTAG